MKPWVLNTESMSLQEALNEIHFYRGVVPVKAYQVLAKHQPEVTPYLIQVLKNMVQRHDRTGDYYVAHIHALLLLSQFREKKAFPIMIELLNLPIDSVDRLLGDMLTETVPKIMTSIYDGNLEALFALLVNHETNVFLRSTIGHCFSALIYQKIIDKGTVLLRLQEIVASGKMNQDQTFFTILANLTIECQFEPLYDVIRAAFKAGMVNNHGMDIFSFENSLSQPIDQFSRQKNTHPITDAASELASWEGYSGETRIVVKIERNAPCPCGSNQKFKKCCIHRLSMT